MKLIEAHKNCFKHDKLMVLYGDDFFYGQKATLSFLTKTEKIFAKINENNSGSINIHWASPSDYFSAVLETGTQFPTFSGDFFPYMLTKVTPELKYWTGFYSLLPNLKRTIYETSELVRLAELMSVLVLETPINTTAINVCMHHDAITATCRPKVADYYRRLLSYATEETLQTLSSVSKTMLGYDQNPTGSEAGEEYRPFLLYNAVNWDREDLFRFESGTSFVEVRDPYGTAVDAQAFWSSKIDRYIVFFQSKLPALSLNVFRIIEHDSECGNCAELSTSSNKLRTLSGKQFAMKISDKGLVQKIWHEDSDLSWEQSFVSFNGSSSGAYIFFPTGTENPTDLTIRSIEIYDGTVFSAAVMTWNRTTKLQAMSQFHQLILLPKTIDTMLWEVEAYAVPNEELMIRFEAKSAKSDIPMYTFDSVAWRQRKRFDTKVLSEMGRNFYPISGAVLLGEKDKGLIFIPQHPLGVGVHSEAYYFHIQRSLKRDDNFGLAHHIEDNTMSRHSFKVVWAKQKQEDFQRSYYEGKLTNRLLSIDSAFSLSLAPVMSVPLRSGMPIKSLSSWLSFDAKNMYLSSANLKDKSLIIRILNFSVNSTDLRWPPIALGQKLNGFGYEVWKESIPYEKSRENVCGFNCSHSSVVTLFNDSVSPSNSEKGKLQPHEFGTFRAVAYIKVYEDVNLSFFSPKSNKTSSSLEEETPIVSTDSQLEEEPVSASSGREETDPLLEDVTTAIRPGTEPLEEVIYTDAPYLEEPDSKDSLSSNVSDPVVSASPPFLPPETLESQTNSSSGQRESTEELKAWKPSPTGATEADFITLEYAFVMSLSLISLGGLIFYYRARKHRSD